MTKRILVSFFTGLFFVCFAGLASATSVGLFGEINYWVTSASRLSGTGGTFAGVDPVAALIGDDLTDGAINIGISDNDSFLLGFAPGITNLPGDDFVIFDGRFSYDSIAIDIGGIEINILNTVFIDSGLDFTLKNTPFTFDLFGAALDLSDWGIAENAVISSMTITSYYLAQADIMGVGLLNNPVPEPTTMFLLGTGLVGVAGAARRRKKNQA